MAQACCNKARSHHALWAMKHGTYIIHHESQVRATFIEIDVYSNDVWFRPSLGQSLVHAINKADFFFVTAHWEKWYLFQYIV